ncbi:MAG: hypothetical protein MJ075_05570 [Oscillospiraceae bacterium]|nr:hypothetical protein [Oscillospiraceae bacterium]
MTWLIVVGIVIAVLLVIGFLRGGACAEYSEKGFELTVIFGPIRLKLLPAQSKSSKKEKKPKKTKTKEKPQREKRNEKKAESGKNKKKGGTLSKVLNVLPTVFDTIGRFFHLLSIDELTLHYSVAGDDPYKVAMQYGAMGGSLGLLGPMLVNNLKVKKWDVSFEPCFIGQPEAVYVKAQATIAVWQLVYLVLRLDFKAIFQLVF